MRNSSMCPGPFGRAVMPLPSVAVLLILVVCAGSPAAGQVGSLAPAPWQLPPAPLTESWPEAPGTCAAGTCAVGSDWGYAYQRHLGYHPYVNRPWFRGEYLMWWTKAANTPPLASTGVLPAGDILAGGSAGLGAHLGGRLTLGWWLSPCEVWGMETSYTFLGSGTVRHRLTSDDHPNLARPFFNVQPPSQEGAVVLATPGPQDEGSFHADLSHRLDSVEVLLRRAVARQCDRHWDLLFGYRYASMAEQLDIESSSTFLTDTEVSDRFHTANEFHGAELGVAAGARHCAWSLDVTGKVALGNTQSRVSVDGSTEVGPTPSVGYPAGMLALASNIGTRERSSFSAIPELRVTFGWDLTCRLKATLGYSLLYWSRVARPGDQIDRYLDPAQFPPGTPADFPAPLFVLTDYWAQGLSFGLDYRF